MALSVLSNFELRIKKILSAGADRRRINSRSQLAVAAAALAVIVPLALLHAQTPMGQGDLSGLVLDRTGARVPNALITASGSGGNREVTRSDAAGAWVFAGVPAGNYTVEVQAPGFKTAKRSLALAAGQREAIEETMEIGNVQETINVIATGQPRSRVTQMDATPQRIRVGGNVQASNLLRQIKPVYPAAARAQGIEGTVLLNAVIGTNGDMLSVAVVNTLVDPDLAAAALSAVKGWHWRPTLLNGEPVEVATTITMNFKLQE